MLVLIELWLSLLIIVIIVCAMILCKSTFYTSNPIKMCRMFRYCYWIIWGDLFFCYIIFSFTFYLCCSTVLLLFFLFRFSHNVFGTGWHTMYQISNTNWVINYNVKAREEFQSSTRVENRVCWKFSQPNNGQLKVVAIDVLNIDWDG